MIRLETPVVCQNGHRATWRAEYSGYDILHLGVSHKENCACPKGERGQGWFVAGPAVVVGYECPRCALVDSIPPLGVEYAARTLQTQGEVDEFMKANPEHRGLKVGDTVQERVPMKFVGST